MPRFNPNGEQEVSSFTPDSLQPHGKDLKNFDNKSLEEQYRIQTEAKNRNLKAMNALKTVSPILLVSLLTEKDETNSSEHFTKTADKIASLSGKVLTDLGLDEDQFKWAKNQIERNFAELYAETSTKKQAFDFSKIEELLPVFVEQMIKRSSEKPIYQSLSSEINVKLSVFFAINQIFLEFADFASQPNFQTEALEALKFALEATDGMVKNISHKMLSERDRGEIFKAILTEVMKAIVFYWRLNSKEKLIQVVLIKPQVKNYLTRIEKIVSFLIKE